MTNLEHAYDLDHTSAISDAKELERIAEDLVDFADELETYSDDPRSLRAIKVNIKDAKADAAWITGGTPKWATPVKDGIHSGDRAFTFNL